MTETTLPTLAAPAERIGKVSDGITYEQANEAYWQSKEEGRDHLLPEMWVTHPSTGRWWGVGEEDVWMTNNVPLCYHCGKQMMAKRIEDCLAMGVVRKYECPSHCANATDDGYGIETFRIAEVLAHDSDQWTP